MYCAGIMFCGMCCLFSCSEKIEKDTRQGKQILLFSKTKAFRHDCIEPGTKALTGYLEKKGITVQHSEDTVLFTNDKLKAFDAVVFFQTSGNILGDEAQLVFQSYIRSGKGFAGVHAAADTEYDWPWYGQLVGAYFADHPDIQPAVYTKTDTLHPSTAHLPARWMRTDECYNFKQIPTNEHILIKLDENTYQGGAHGDNHPVAWCKSFEGGRSFYTSLGHTVESYSDTLFLEHLYQGILWAASGK